MIQFGLRTSYLKLLKNYMIATFILLAQIGISKTSLKYPKKMYSATMFVGNDISKENLHAVIIFTQLFNLNKRNMKNGFYSTE